MNPESEAPGASPTGSAHGIAARLAQWFTTRFELVAFEFAEERRHIARLIVLGAAAAALGLVALFLLTLAVLWALPPHWRALGAAVTGVIYAATAVTLAWKLRQSILQRPPPFSVTLDELRRDRDWFKSLK